MVAGGDRLPGVGNRRDGRLKLRAEGGFLGRGRLDLLNLSGSATHVTGDIVGDTLLGDTV